VERLNSSIFKRTSEEKGMALVETAIVILLLIFVTFAMMEYGWIFHRIQQVNNAAREGVRSAVLPDNTPADATAVANQLLNDFGIAGATVTISPADTADLETGDLITMTVQVPVSNVELTGLFLSQAFLGSTLSTSATMAKESP